MAELVRAHRLPEASGLSSTRRGDIHVAPEDDKDARQSSLWLA